MLQNFDLVSTRIKSYVCFPDNKFKTSRGLPAQEAEVEQKLRQYWADKTIPNSKKLEGLEYDLSKFDPENTSNKEMRKITELLASMGILDYGTTGWLDGVDLEFNHFGDEINIGKKTNLFANFDRQLKIYESEISAGKVFLNDEKTSLYTAISVVMALQERAKELRPAGLVDTKA